MGKHSQCDNTRMLDKRANRTGVANMLIGSQAIMANSSRQQTRLIVQIFRLANGTVKQQTNAFDRKNITKRQRF